MERRGAFPYRGFLVARTYEPQADASAMLVAEALAHAVGDVAVARVETDALYQAAEHAALAVVGTPTGRRPPGLPGGDPSQLAARLGIPVVVVPRGRTTIDVPSGRSIVCGIGSVADTPCASAAGALADVLDLQLVLVHVTSQVSVAPLAAPYAPAAPATGLVHDQLAARELLGEIARRAGRAAPGASCPRLAQGRGADELCRVGGDERAVLIAVTASRAGRLSAAVRGSVTRDLLRQADRLVFVWPRQPNPALAPG
jgi:nucleotide-binding universal stress UspA family protein